MVPTLRFPEFRNEGEWGNTQLGRLGDFTGGGTPSKSNDSYWRGDIPWISSSDIYEDSIHEFNISRYISEEALNDSATKLVPEKSVLLVSRVGAGKLAITKNSVCTSQDFTNFTPAKDNLVFLGYYLKSRNKALLEYSQGMAIKGFTKDDVSKLDVYIPSMGEQQKIADCLTSIDELITAQTQKIDALKAHKKGLMQQLFPAEGESVPKLRFPEFRDKGGWEEKPFGKMATFSKGKGVSKSDISPNGKQPCIRYGELYTHYGETIETVNSYTDVPADELVLSEENDVIIPASGETKEDIATASCVLNSGIALGGDLNIIRSNLNGVFLSYYLNNIKKKKIAQLAQGISVVHLYPSQLQRLNINIPSMSEQQKIAACLTSIDELIANQAQKIEALKSHKKGLMQQLFITTADTQQLAMANMVKWDDSATTTSPNHYKTGFARQLLAAEILHHCHKHPTMGRIKLQKLIHLSEYYAELNDIHGNYHRAAAGPFDNKLMRGVANGLEKQKWFREVHRENRTFYEPMEASGQHSKYLQRWSEHLHKIHQIISYLTNAKTNFCEVVSTLYAAWNDLLIEGREPTDKEIIREASDPKRWHESKAKIEGEKWVLALEWMRKKGLVPRGYGAHTAKRIE